MAKKKSGKTASQRLAKRKSSQPRPATNTTLLGDVRALIDQARVRTAQAVNSALVELYWEIGKRIRQDVLENERAEYGEHIVQTLSAQLTGEYGRGFGARNLFHMIRFAELFPDEQIVNALRTQLSWTHFRELLSIEDRLKREFYAEMCRVERWSTRTLRHKIGHLLYERTALAKKPEKLIAADLAALRDEDRMSPDLVFRDPYFLDFLGLTGQYAEKDLEKAILRELEAFILELGTDFAFVARQKRMTVDDEDYYLDLLFFHRRLRRLVAIDFHPVRYADDCIPLRVRTSKRKRQQQLCRVHVRSQETTCRTRCRASCVHQAATTTETHLLRGLHQPEGCNEAREVSQVRVGKTISQKPARRLSHGVKLGKFQAADKGQMELYLRWLEAYETQPGEEPPLGLILCAGKTEEHVELMRLDESGIRAAQYLTELPPREILERKLHDAIRLAREHLAKQPTKQEPQPRLPAPPKEKAQRKSTKGKPS